MRYEIKFKTPFTKSQLKILKCDYHYELNGCYWYDKDLIIINVASVDFEDLNDDGIIKVFTQVDTHERIHKEIYDILGDIYANETEERFVCLMTEQEKW